MQRHAASSGRETEPFDRRPSTRGGCSTATAPPSKASTCAASAALPEMLTAVPPQQAWSQQLARAGASDHKRSHAHTASRDVKRDATAQAAAASGREQRAAPRTKCGESSVDRILKSSVKQHTYSYAPLRPPPSLELARSPYDPPGGIADPVQIRRDVKDSVCSQE